MDFMLGCVLGDDEQLQEDASNTQKGKKALNRHTSHQIQTLETFFKDCPHPDENQRCELSKTLGMTAKQIKFWFQNKRTQTKTKSERVDNSTLRAENERIQYENLSIKEELKNVLCQSCGGPPFEEIQHKYSLQTLQLENSYLKEEHEKMSNILANYMGNANYMRQEIPQIDSLMPALHLQKSSLDSLSAGPAIGSLAPANFDLRLNDTVESASAGSILSPYGYPFVGGISSIEKTFMFEIASSAMDELIRLLRVNEPLWIKSLFDHGRYVLNQESYEKIFPRASYSESSSALIESSKDSGIVNMTAMNLVEMLLDPNKWMDLFPTIVTKARVIQVLATGLLENKSGHLQLMSGQMHILSPLVPSREFYFLRHCQQIELGVWVVADVSYNSLMENASSSHSWRLPSGCMIQEMDNGFCKVTWVEHVKVDDKTQIHRLYKDLICSGFAYGAERWIITLQRMCERLAFFNKINAPREKPGEGVTLIDGKKSIMKLAHRMVKSFCAALSMSDKVNFPQLLEVNNNRVQVSIRNSTEPGQPSGLIVIATTSLWLPLHPQTVFNFFSNGRIRVQWDFLSSGNSVHEVAHISYGTYPGNCISIIRPPFVSTENILMLQESCSDPLGSMVVYAPIDIPAMNLTLSGEDSSGILILPSGFVISTDGRSELTTGALARANAERSAGSLLTVAFQLLVPISSPPSSSSSSSSAPTSQELNMEFVATVISTLNSTVQKIKVALGCPTEA